MGDQNKVMLDSQSKQRVRWYREHVFLHMLKLMKQKDGWADGQPVPLHLYSHSDCDGAIHQIQGKYARVHTHTYNCMHCLTHIH